jgi:hypothetical protein
MRWDAGVSNLTISWSPIAPTASLPPNNDYAATARSMGRDPIGECGSVEDRARFRGPHLANLPDAASVMLEAEPFFGAE